jgi:hypothetical protein
MPAWPARKSKEKADAVDAERRAKEWIAKVEEAAARPENTEIVATLKKAR